MRSAEAGAVPEPSASQRPGVRHHTLGPAGSPKRPTRSLRGPHRRVSGHDCRRSVRGGPRLHLRLGRYGMSPSPSGYLASEQMT
jgi:hypothetical protein